MNRQTHANGPFVLWQPFWQQSLQFWSQVAALDAPAMALPAWRQATNLWSAFWTQALTLSPEALRSSPKAWMEQLDIMAQSLADMAGTEAFSKMQSQWLKQQLAWQEKATQFLHPQIDAALRGLNLPSRDQIERLFERVIGLEERLDDLEVMTQSTLQTCQQTSNINAAEHEATP